MKTLLDFTIKHHLAFSGVMVIAIFTLPFIAAAVMPSPFLAKIGAMLVVAAILGGIIIPWGIAMSQYNSRRPDSINGSH